MGYFAHINDSNIVDQVIVSDSDYIQSGRQGDPSRWIETKMDDSIRCRYATIGYYYDAKLDVFLKQKPFDSWVLNTKTFDWNSPTSEPEQGKHGIYYSWNEQKLAWCPAN